MKFTLQLLVAVGLLAGTGLLNAQAPTSEESSHGDPFTPVGSLRVTPTVVQPGVQPDMTWEIEYPKSIPDLAVIVPPGKLVTTNEKPVKLSVRVAGVSFSSGDTDLPVALWIRSSTTGTWELLFYGNESTVNSNEVVYEATVHEGTQIDFAARGQSSTGSWYGTQWTLYDTPQVNAVTDGDSLPSESYAFTTGEIEGFMTQFVDSNNEVEAGPRDIIHLFELGSTEPGTSAFDMQDIVVVTTMGRNNNGHGNNLDGVDVSNPGQGGGGPNGTADTNPDPDAPGGYIDDERVKIKKKK